MRCDCALPEEVPELWTCPHGFTWHRRVYYMVVSPGKLSPTEVIYLPVKLS